LSTCKLDAGEGTVNKTVVAGEGFEPSKEEPGDLQSPIFHPITVEKEKSNR
jgi:hypothetical protein